MTDEIAVRTDGSLFSTHTYVCTYLIALNNVLHTININTNLYPTLEDRILVAIVVLVLECVLYRNTDSVPSTVYICSQAGGCSGTLP